MTNQANAPTRPSPVVVLPEILDLRAAGPLAAELAGRRGLDLQVDASRVRTLGGQCLQVLLSAQSCWLAEGAQFHLAAPSDEFSSGVALFGAVSLIHT